ncbi:MAG: LicD family protein [Clostridia bacterium]|nr:LicD family protein [Clostridia bacterium]
MYQNLEALQQEQKHILDEIVAICEQHNLRYFLVAGTLLGAVRHQDIIPWDDDIDIGMPRADYNKFLEIAGELLPEHLFLQTYETDPAYMQNFAKVRNSETTHIEQPVKHLQMNHGIYVDIFPYDGVPDANWRQYLHNKRIVLQCVLIRYFWDTPYVQGSSWRKLFKGILSIFTNQQRLQRKLDNILSKYDYDKSQTVGSLLSGYKMKTYVSKEVYDEVEPLPFGEKAYLCPKNYEAVLVKIYRNYMQLPPEEKRGVRHNIAVSDLEKSYREYF